MRNNFELGLCLRCDFTASLCLGYYAIDIAQFIGNFVYGLMKFGVCEEALFRVLQSDDRGRNSHNNHPEGKINKIGMPNQQTSGYENRLHLLRRRKQPIFLRFGEDALHRPDVFVKCAISSMGERSS